jgi:hypothetical protein
MTEEKVQKVENICDLMEKYLEPLKDYYYYTKKLSLPASIAAVRLYYYIGSQDDPENNEIYNKIEYVFSNEIAIWEKLSHPEKIALLDKIRAPRVFVYY